MRSRPEQNRRESAVCHHLGSLCYSVIPSAAGSFAREPILRSRGTPCLLARTTGDERSSLHEPHRVGCAVKMPPRAKREAEAATLVPEYRERYAANLRRELPRIPFVSCTTCHPEAAESSAKPRTPNEGSMHSVGSTTNADKCTDPSAHKGRGPQDDNVTLGMENALGLFRLRKSRPAPRFQNTTLSPVPRCHPESPRNSIQLSS